MPPVGPGMENAEREVVAIIPALSLQMGEESVSEVSRDQRGPLASDPRSYRLRGAPPGLAAEELDHVLIEGRNVIRLT
jgi:hypothetical protein